MAKVLIVDEHVLVARLLKEELAEEGHHVVISTDPVKAMETVGFFDPDILIIDPFLTRRARWDVLCRIKGLRNKIEVIIYTGHQDLAKDPHMEMASAFALKRSSMEEIKALVRNVAPEENPDSASLQTKWADRASGQARPPLGRGESSAQEKGQEGSQKNQCKNFSAGGNPFISPQGGGPCLLT